MQIGDTTITLQIWDTAGQERFQSLGKPFYRGADACVLVYDVSSALSFERLEAWRDQFIKFGDITDAHDFPFVVLGNKADLDPSKHAVSIASVKAWCESKGGIPHFLVRFAGRSLLTVSIGIGMGCHGGDDVCRCLPRAVNMWMMHS